MKVIEFQSVSKAFRRDGGRRSIRQCLGEVVGLRREESFQALRNVTFSIEAGEAVAVVGSNGAGKSTLLNLVSGLSTESGGQVVVRGRVAPLLELGAGFHPDLTGRENVKLNASLLGFSRSEFKALYHTIVDYAELRSVIDEPLRTYSAGMTMRLAFSVAVHVDPEILIIDEVIAVGDQWFQKKCVDKVLEFRERGKTMLCVSHSTVLLRRLCSRAIWIEKGQVMMEGVVGEVLAAYEQSICIR